MAPSENLPWVQVIGGIRVHRPGRDSHELAGASRVLLSILVAAGPGGITIEEIANAYWHEKRPASWKIALRVAASHLAAQLPDGWDVVARDGRFRLQPGDGFVDIWEVDQQAGADNSPDGRRRAWLRQGQPFDGVRGISIVEDAARRYAPLISKLAAGPTRVRPDETKLPHDASAEDLVHWFQGLRRTILLAPPAQHEIVGKATEADDLTETHLVVGERRLLLPLGPFAMTFPELRSKLDLERGIVEPGSADRACRIVTDALAAKTFDSPQRLILANAHELDTPSLQLASLLIERGRLSDFSMIVCGDNLYRDLRWLDFVHRSQTAGCDLIEVD